MVMHGLLDHPKFSVFAFIEDCSLSVFISTRSDSLDRFSQWLYLWCDVIQADGLLVILMWRRTDRWLFDFRHFVWDFAVPVPMQPADIQPHLAFIVHGSHIFQLHDAGLW